jgi:arsenate reductase
MRSGRLRLSNGRFNVLFLCTANSARSILAEAVLNRIGGDRFRAYSAGSFPRGRVNPVALELLRSLGHDTSGFRSKSWDEFATEDAPRIDLVVTVCDNAAGEICPIWPGHPLKAHWGIEDPASADGLGKLDAFRKAYDYLRAKIGRLVTLPVETMDVAALKAELAAIGRSEGATVLAATSSPADLITDHP